MEALLVYPLCYTLQLEEGKYYVGITTNLNYRWAQHISGQGSKWTRMYKPKDILSVCQGGAEMERRVTLELMQEHGFEHVRGGPWCKVDLKTDPSKPN